MPLVGVLDDSGAFRTGWAGIHVGATLCFLADCVGCETVGLIETFAAVGVRVFAAVGLKA